MAPESVALPVSEDEAPRPVEPAAGFAPGLPAGTRLRDYEVRGVLHQGAFGVVYLAWDYWLRRQVAIKEFLPTTLAARRPGSTAVELRRDADGAAFSAGLKGFVAEARMLAHFDHDALVRVYRFWEDNGTAYMVMSYADGPSLEAALSAAGRPQEETEVRGWLRPLLDALSIMHASRCCHHDIGPDNIILTRNGPVLLDFGSARRTVEGMSRGPAAGLKPGYAPLEQYGRPASAPPDQRSDLYALAAVAYRAVTGERPVAAELRLDPDPLPPLARIAAHRCSVGFVRAIDAALAVDPEQRPRNDTAFRELMGGIDRPLPSLSNFADIDLMAEPFAPEPAGASRVVTVPMLAKAPPSAAGSPAPVEAEGAHPAPAALTDEPPAPRATPAAAVTVEAVPRRSSSIAAAARRARGWPRWAVGTAAGVLGSAAALAMYSYTRSTAHPGHAAVPPVTATAVVAAPTASIAPAAAMPPSGTLQPGPVPAPAPAPSPPPALSAPQPLSVMSAAAPPTPAARPAPNAPAETVKRSATAAEGKAPAPTASALGATPPSTVASATAPAAPVAKPATSLAAPVAPPAPSTARNVPSATPGQGSTPIAAPPRLDAVANPARPEREGLAGAAKAAPRLIPVDLPPANEADRRLRCDDLLQEATLRRLTAAEGVFFKRECRR